MLYRITVFVNAIITLVFFISSSTSLYGQLQTIGEVKIDQSAPIDYPANYDGDIKIVFDMEVDGISQIFFSDQSFANPIQLTTFSGWSYGPRLSPDGTKIVYFHDNSTGSSRGDIWVMNIDGSNNNQITFSGLDGARYPCWHNNGQQIIYEWGSSTSEQVIRIVDIDGNNDQILFNNINDKDTNPYMDPVDNNFITYLYDSGNWTYDRQVRIRNISSGTDQVVIPSNGLSDYGLSYSNDGEYLLWSEHSSNFNQSYLKKINLSTLAITPLLTTNKHMLAKFTSDNQSIVYCTKSIVNGESAIWLMDKDGNNSLPLFQTANEINFLDVKGDPNGVNQNVNISITLKSQSTNQLLSFSDVDLANTPPNGSTTILQGQTNFGGIVNFSVPYNSDFTVLVNKQGYDPYVKTYLNVTSNKNTTFYLSNFSNQTSYSCPQVITGLFTLGEITSNGVCSMFDINPSPSSNIYNLNDFVYNNYSSKPFKYYFLNFKIPNTIPNQPEAVPTVLISPTFPGDIQPIFCNLADLTQQFLQLVLNLPSVGNMICLDGFTNLAYETDGREFESYTILYGLIEFKQYTGNGGYGLSALDQLSVDNQGRKTGSYYENGVFIEDKYEIPNTYYSGHLSHPNLIFFEPNVDPETFTHSLIPTALGEYTFLQKTITDYSVFDNAVFETATSFDPIPKTLQFPDSLNSPTPIITLTSDSILTGEQQTFDASSSFDPQGLALSYEWYLNNVFISGETTFAQSLPDGEYTVMLKAINTLNNSSIANRYFIVGNPTSINDTKIFIPDEYSLNQNYPNPFNPSTTISYSLASPSLVQMKIFNILGQEVATLVNEEKPSGNYQVEFDARNLSSGIYLYKIQAGDFVQTRKMILLK